MWEASCCVPTIVLIDRRTNSEEFNVLLVIKLAIIVMRQGKYMLEIKLGKYRTCSSTSSLLGYSRGKRTVFN
jgi:hypothetical protein